MKRAFLVGGYEQQRHKIAERLAKIGVEVVGHYGGPNPARLVVPADAEVVLIVTDFAGHPLTDKALEQARAIGIRSVGIRVSAWSASLRYLVESGVISPEQAKEASAPLRVTLGEVVAAKLRPSVPMPGADTAIASPSTPPAEKPAEEPAPPAPEPPAEPAEETTVAGTKRSGWRGKHPEATTAEAIREREAYAEELIRAGEGRDTIIHEKVSAKFGGVGIGGERLRAMRRRLRITALNGPDAAARRRRLAEKILVATKGEVSDGVIIERVKILTGLGVDHAALPVIRRKHGFPASLRGGYLRAKGALDTHRPDPAMVALVQTIEEDTGRPIHTRRAARPTVRVSRRPDAPPVRSSLREELATLGTLALGLAETHRLAEITLIWRKGAKPKITARPIVETLGKAIEVES